MSISLQPGVPATLTVSVPQPNFHAVSTARLYIRNPKRGNTALAVAPSGHTKGSVTFDFTLSKRDAGDFYDCENCSYQGSTYQVMLFEGQGQALDPPFRVIASGTVSVSGSPLCADCEGGEDPPNPEDPPSGGGGGDNPYGPSGPGDPLGPLPSPPDNVCLPPDFVAPAPTLPTPCS